jgi:hypothetical protein
LSKEILREEGVPESEEDMDDRCESCEEDAREASSRESRGGWAEVLWRFE